MRHTPFRGVLIWIAALTGSYVVVVPLAAYVPNIGVYFRLITMALLLALTYQCIRYLMSDPPDWRRFRNDRKSGN